SRCGHITAAHDDRSAEGLEQEAKWLRDELDDRSLIVLGAAEMGARIGSRTYTGGVLDRNGGTLQPEELMRAMVVTLIAGGVRMHEASPATSIREDGGDVVIATPRGNVRAAQVIL